MSVYLLGSSGFQIKGFCKPFSKTKKKRETQFKKKMRGQTNRNSSAPILSLQMVDGLPPYRPRFRRPYDH